MSGPGFRDATPEELAIAAVAFDSAPVGIIYSEQRVISRANAAFCAMFGLEPEEVVGQPLEMFYPSQADSDRIVENARKPLTSTGLYADERTMMRQDGQLFWCAVSGHSITPHDPFEGIVWCFQDLSRQWNLSGLSPRDREIAILTCEGRTAKEIGRTLQLSPRTVESYLARLKHKLHVRNVAELVSRIRLEQEQSA